MDKEAIQNYIKTKTDGEWTEPLITSFKECFKMIDENSAKIDKIFTSPPMNINKADCNYKFWAIEFCKENEMYLVSEGIESISICITFKVP